MSTREEMLLYWREYHRKRRLDPAHRERLAELQRIRRANNYLEKHID